MDRKKILVIGNDSETKFIKDVLQNKHDVVIYGGAAGAGRTFALGKAMQSAKEKGIKIVEFKPGINQFDSGSEFIFNEAEFIFPEIKTPKDGLIEKEIQKLGAEFSKEHMIELKARIHRKSQSIQKQFKEIKRTGNSNITPKKKKRK